MGARCLAAAQFLKTQAPSICYLLSTVSHPKLLLLFLAQLRLSLADHPFASILLHGDKDPEPMQRLHKQGGKGEGVFDEIEGVRAALDGAQSRNSAAVALGEVNVSGGGEEHEEAEGQLVGPVIERGALGKAGGDQVADAQEGEQDADEGRDFGGLVEGRRRRLVVETLARAAERRKRSRMRTSRIEKRRSYVRLASTRPE